MESRRDQIRPRLHRQLQWQELDTSYLRQLISLAQAEDLEGAGLLEVPRNPGDPTSLMLDPDLTGRSRLVARQPMTVCGLGLVPLVLQAYDISGVFSTQAHDGQQVLGGAILGTLEGRVAPMLQAERVLLNFLQHLSGIATQTRRYVEALGPSHTRLLDTRKTTPGFRILEKYAVACGGGWNHRMGLYDRIMLKDNHLASSGSDRENALTALIRQTRQRHPDLIVEVEVDHPEQIPPVLEAEPDVILLDNFSNQALSEAVRLIGKHAYTEASGGITRERLPSMAGLGLDFISCGSLVHQSTWQDIGLDWAIV